MADPVDGECRIIERFAPGESDAVGSRYGEIGPRAGTGEFERFVDYTTAEEWLLDNYPARPIREMRGFIIYEHTADWWVEMRDFAENP